jgi:hypothetical protein
LARLAAAETVTGIWGFPSGFSAGSLAPVILGNPGGATGADIVIGTPYTGGDGGLFFDDNSGFRIQHTIDDFLSGDQVIGWPNASGVVMLAGNEYTLLGGLLSTLKSSTSASGASFMDSSIGSKKLRFVLSTSSGESAIQINTSSGRVYHTRDLAGDFVIVGNDPPAVAVGALGKVDLTGQLANIVTTNLSNTPPAGLYEIEIYLVCTTGGTGAGTLAVTIGWTDVLGATTSTPINLFSISATGRTTGRQFIQRTSGNITYAVTATGGYGAGPAAVYAVYVRVKTLG